LALGITKISIVFLSISLIASFGLTSNQAFAGGFDLPFPTSCEDCDTLQQEFERFCPQTDGVSSQTQITTCQQLEQVLQTCRPTFCPAVGGVFEGVDTTSLLVTGAQSNAAWMIPVIVSAIGIGIVIARKF